MALPPPFSSDCPPLWSGGPDFAHYYNFPNKTNTAPSAAPNTRSAYPITTGTSVFALRYKDGIVIAADNMGSYGSLARYPGIQRVWKVNDTTVIGSSGDIADFQYLHSIIKSKQVDEEIRGGGVTMKPQALHCWLTRVLYNRRSKFDPLWNTVVVGGMQQDKPFLGVVDMIGTSWEEDKVATGLGAYVAIPIMNDALEKCGGSANLSKEQAKEIIERCIRVAFYRDCRATNKYHIAFVDAKGTTLEGPLLIDSDWKIAHGVCGYE